MTVAPLTWVAALLFLLFIVPGLVFDMLSERRRVLSSESTFRELSRVALASVAFSGTSITLFLIGTQTIRPTWLPDPARLLRDGITYAAGNYHLLAWTAIGIVLLAVLMAIAIHLLLSRVKGGGPISQRSSWTRVLRDDCPNGKKPYAKLRFDDGSACAGFVQDYTPDIEIEDREIVLRPPHLKVKPANGALRDVPVHVERIVIKGADVRTLYVSYWPDPSQDVAM